ncbi:MAG: TIGR00730 family Rossman fold protein [Limisphaerales bacterium]
MKRICVYCGSNHGADPGFTRVTKELGTLLADEGIGLVYGAGNVGLMGEVADAVLAGGGEVIGAMPGVLKDKEVTHLGLTEVVYVDSMHERKQFMADRADGFIALPGGIGTLEELIEVFTWLQLGIHTKPIGVLNIAGYYDKLLKFLDHMVTEKLLRQEQRDMLLVDEAPAGLLQQMRAFKPTEVEKWFGRDGTKAT